MDFEMQVAAYEFWKNRSIYYVSKMYTEQIKQGEDYDKLQKCIQGADCRRTRGRSLCN